jgi:hypothetical protein
MSDLISGFPALNLPDFGHQVRLSDEQRTEIFDAFRKKYVVLTPEEWVRQHLLHYLCDHLNYPANLLAVEQSLKLGSLQKRADVVVYQASLTPWMLIECKAAEVPLTQAVFDQAARYNLHFKVPFLVITNGLRLFAAKIDFQTGQVQRLESLPSFEM